MNESPFPNHVKNWFLGIGALMFTSGVYFVCKALYYMVLHRAHLGVFLEILVQFIAGISMVMVVVLFTWMNPHIMNFNHFKKK